MPAAIPLIVKSAPLNSSLLLYALLDSSLSMRNSLTGGCLVWSLSLLKSDTCKNPNGMIVLFLKLTDDFKSLSDSSSLFFPVISSINDFVRLYSLEITGKNKLLESDRDLKSSVSLRNKTIIPLGFLQVSLLRRLRDQTRQPPVSEFLIDKDESRRAYSRSELLRGALLTINGIAAGMRNTG